MLDPIPILIVSGIASITSLGSAFFGLYKLHRTNKQMIDRKKHRMPETPYGGACLVVLNTAKYQERLVYSFSNLAKDTSYSSLAVSLKIDTKKPTVKRKPLKYSLPIEEEESFQLNQLSKLTFNKSSNN